MLSSRSLFYLLKTTQTCLFFNINIFQYIFYSFFIQNYKLFFFIFILLQTGVINLGSYNYLGFADDWKETCRDDVVSTFDSFGTSMCSSPMDAGTTVVHAELEALVCEFLNKEACCVFNMGYGTNASTIPAIVGKGSLIISDSLNHSSIVNGARAR